MTKSLVIVSLALLAPATAFAGVPSSNDGAVQLVDAQSNGFGVQTPLGTFSLNPNQTNAPGYYGPGYYGPGYQQQYQYPGYYGPGYQGYQAPQVYAPPGAYQGGAQQQHVHLRVVPPNGGSLFVYDGDQVVARVDQPQTLELSPRQQYGVVATRGGQTIWSGFIPGSNRRVDVSFGQSDTPNVQTRGPSLYPGFGGYYGGPGSASPTPPGYYGQQQGGYFMPGPGYEGD